MYGNCMFKQLNKLSIFDLNKLYKLKFVYSALNNLLPKCLNTFFTRNSTLHVHKTRHFDKLFIRPVSTTFRKLFVVNSAPILWNELPDNIISSNSLPIFCSACKKYLLQISQISVHMLINFPFYIAYFILLTYYIPSA